ncbi:MAG: DUF3592 domain-containing protein [Hyphomicrobiaceae bacterium]|nr:DUF3592 domain-containing protein [Hyphomicrobiaceae bacterium]
MRYNPGTGLVLKTIFLGMGVMMALVGGALLLMTVQAVSKSDRTSGEVVAIEKSHPMPASKGGAPRVTYTPVIEFKAPDGATHRFTSSWHSTEPAYAVGEKVGILYRRDDPSRAFVDSFAETWLLPIIFSGIGLVFTLVGLVVRHTKARP